MSEIRPKKLHLAKCIEDLDNMFNVPDLKTKKARLLCNTAQKIFETAEQYHEKGDEEFSYVYYMKYLKVIAYLSKDQEYQRDKKFYNDLLCVKNPNKAISMAEVLKKSLISRYENEHKTKRLNDIKENEIIKQKIEDNRKKPKEAISLIITEPAITYPDTNEVFITSLHLYTLIKDKRPKLMIIDTRPADDFTISHISHPHCISVPEECISPGQSANILEQNMPTKSKAVWTERAAMDLIVMLDWSSTAFIPATRLYLLKTILLKWDVKVHYKREPVALYGGYEEWLLKYPSLSTNPHVSPPNQERLMDDMLSDIDYPNWSDLSPVTTKPPTGTVTSTQITGTSVLRSQLNAPTINPVVDRSSKAAAIQVYEERSRNMQIILEKQEQIADTSLSLEMQRIEAEQDWEKVRSQQELGSLNPDVKAIYQLREQEIISQLMQLENKQYDMEQENQNLREQLEEYQKRDREEAQRLADSVAKATQGIADGTTEDVSTSIQDAETSRLLQEQKASARDLAAKRARIRAVEEQREELDRQREILETERKRKLAEARDKKKPTYEKDEDGDTYMVPLNDSPSSTNLNRSQSSPNIAKISEDEEEQPLPSFDRSTKPAIKLPASNELQRQRDFEPVWGDVGRGLTGLKNLGNTCYMNSIIQCLNNTAILGTYFYNGKYREHINQSHGTRGAISEELAAVVRALWSGEYRFIATKELRNEVGKHQRAFRGCEQQDSHEFLTILMDWLHDELQFPMKPPPKESLPPSEKAWIEFTKSRESLILRLFYGQIKSTVKCTVCGKESVTYESFSNLSLELPANANRCNLSDCLKLYLNGETIPGWDCPSCKEKRDALKKLDISRLPPVLVIHFKRFYLDSKEYMCNAYRKKQTYIDFPLEKLDMRQFSLHNTSNHLYNLYAVSNHYGSMEGGHYTAYCKSSTYGKWYKYDDHVVTEISPNDVKSSAAYILFYTSCSQLFRLA